MDVVQVLAEACYGEHGTVCDVAAFVQHEVAQTGSSLHDLLDTRVLQLGTVGEVEDAECIVCGRWWETQKGVVGDAPAMGQPQLSQMWSVGQEGCDGFVFEVPAIVQVDFEDIATVSGECNDGPVRELLATVQFELGWLAGQPVNRLCTTHPLQMSTALRDRLQRVVRDLLAICDVQAL